MGVKAISTKFGIGDTSGITEFSDGTRSYWMEGRSSETVYELNDGTIQRRPTHADETEYMELMSEGEYGEDGGYFTRDDHNKFERLHGNPNDMSEEEWIEYSGQEEEDADAEEEKRLEGERDHWDDTEFEASRGN